jgi:hypothetical protein
MAQKISENTEVQLDLKTIGMLVAGAVSLAAMYFTLQKDITLAKELPKPEVSRTEYDLKDELIRTTIMDIDDKVKDNSEKLDKIDDKLFIIINKD